MLEKLKKLATPSNTVVLIGLLFILFLGNFLRFKNYDVVPHPGETTDEYGFAWAGLSLIKEGVPESWSGVESVTTAEGSAAIPYKNLEKVKINVDNIYDKEPSRPPFSIAKPWFDKPPGFALFIGGYSYLKGAREYVQTGVGIIRRPMVRLAVLTTLLLFILALRLFNKWVGLLSALLYSVIPTAVISSRLAMAENGYVPIFLGALIFIDCYLKKKKDVYLVLATSLSALAILFKLSGISILLSLLLVLAVYGPKRKKAETLLKTFLIGISGLVLFFIYGAFIDWKVFIDVFNAQSNLFYGAGADIFYSLLTRNRIVDFFTDGWMLLAWICAFAIGFTEWRKKRGTTIIIISLFSYLIVFLFFGSEPYGWYRFPFIPFLIIALSRFIERLYLKPNLFVIFSLFILPLGVSLHRIFGLIGFQNYVGLYRFLLLFVLSVFGLDLLLPERFDWAKRLILVFLLTLSIVFAVREFYLHTYETWFYIT